MDDEFFDRYTRTLGHDVTRREFFRLTAGVVTFAILSRLPAIPQFSIFAESSENCFGGNCSDVNDAGNCESDLIKVEKPFSPPVANGCGAKGGIKFPEQVFLANFKAGCDGHDICYGSCTDTKTICDEALLDDLYAECMRNYPSPLSLKGNICRAAADKFYWAVDNFGNGPWIDAQKDSCMCCNPNEDACEGCSQCVNGVCESGCSDGQICCNDRCVDSDKNNCGECGIACDGCSQCIDGGCISSCADGEICCNGNCIEDCGGCEGCGPGMICCGGICQPECGPCQECDPIHGGCVSLCDPFKEQCCGGACWEFGCCDDGDGGKICCPEGCSCCGPGVGGGCQTNCTGSGEPCGAACGG